MLCRLEQNEEGAYVVLNSSSRHNEVSSPHHINENSRFVDDLKVTHDLAKFFKYMETFSGKMDGNVNEGISNYLFTATDYEFPNEKKLQYLRNVFDG